MDKPELKQLLDNVASGKLSSRTALVWLLTEMGRGSVTLMVDEDIYDLAPMLRMLNYTVHTVTAKFRENAVKKELNGCVFITLNGRDFSDAADMRRFHYGLIWLRTYPDAKVVSRRVEKVLMKHNFRATLEQIVKA
jgi:hypothetical protein